MTEFLVLIPGSTSLTAISNGKLSTTTMRNIGNDTISNPSTERIWSTKGKELDEHVEDDNVVLNPIFILLLVCPL